jgi:hypothetical protein
VISVGAEFAVSPPPPAPALAIVTAASQLYFDERRLHNLVGSIHFWEPHATIDFYNLGEESDAPHSPATRG